MNQLYKMLMASYKSDRRIKELPAPKFYSKADNSYIDWMNKINELYFFGNQSEIFDCFLTTLNKVVHVSYNQEYRLSIDFAEFIYSTLPKNILDKRKRFFKSAP